LAHCRANIGSRWGVHGPENRLRARQFPSLDLPHSLSPTLSFPFAHKFIGIMGTFNVEPRTQVVHTDCHISRHRESLHCTHVPSFFLAASPSLLLLSCRDRLSIARYCVFQQGKPSNLLDRACRDRHAHLLLIPAPFAKFQVSQIPRCATGHDVSVQPTKCWAHVSPL